MRRASSRADAAADRGDRRRRRHRPGHRLAGSRRRARTDRRLRPAARRRATPAQSSWAAAGMLAPVTEVHYGEEALLTLTLAARDRWAAFAARARRRPAGSTRDTAPRARSSVARDADDLARFEELAVFQAKLGLDVTRLRAREVRALEPALSPRVRGGFLVAGDHSVDNRALVLALRAACARAGVELRAEPVHDLDDARRGDGDRRGRRGERAAAARAPRAAGQGSAAAPARRAAADPHDPRRRHLPRPARRRPADRGRHRRGEGRRRARHRRWRSTSCCAPRTSCVPGVTELAFTEAVVGLRPAHGRQRAADRPLG